MGQTRQQKRRRVQQHPRWLVRTGMMLFASCLSEVCGQFCLCVWAARRGTGSSSRQHARAEKAYKSDDDCSHQPNGTKDKKKRKVKGVLGAEMDERGEEGGKCRAYHEAHIMWGGLTNLWCKEGACSITRRRMSSCVEKRDQKGRTIDTCQNVCSSSRRV